MLRLLVLQFCRALRMHRVDTPLRAIRYHKMYAIPRPLHVQLLPRCAPARARGSQVQAVTCLSETLCVRLRTSLTHSMPSATRSRQHHGRSAPIRCSPQCRTRLRRPLVHGSSLSVRELRWIWRPPPSGLRQHVYRLVSPTAARSLTMRKKDRSLFQMPPVQVGLVRARPCMPRLLASLPCHLSRRGTSLSVWPRHHLAPRRLHKWQVLSRRAHRSVQLSMSLLPCVSGPRRLCRTSGPRS